MARDDFSKSVIEQLRLRVGSRCANPECRCPTTGPGSGVAGVNSIGVAAHLYAASPGGPRFHKEMSRKERRSVENGLWLCSNCARKIDRDVEKFPISLLLDWKSRSEELARSEQGQRLANKADATDQLVAALTGASRRFIPDAIANTHKAAATALEALDPRFRVKSSFAKGITSFAIAAREDVSVTLSLTGENASIWQAMMHGVFERGEIAELPMQDVQFSGSPLIESIGEERGANAKLILEPPYRNATVKVGVSKSSSISMDEFSGKLYRGTSALRLTSKGYGGVAEIQLNFRCDESGLCNSTIVFSPCFEAWNNLKVSALPYFSKMKLLGEALSAGGKDIRLTVELEGELLLSGSNFKIEDSEYFEQWTNYIAYVERARALSAYTGACITLSYPGGFTAEDHQALATAVDTLEGKLVFSGESVKSDPEVSVVVLDASEIDTIFSQGEFTEFMMVEPSNPITSLVQRWSYLTEKSPFMTLNQLS